MQLKLESEDLDLYLQSSEIIDYDKEEIISLADKIFSESRTGTDFIKNTYEWVRDNVSHSADINGTIVTCKASEVLKAREGICFAKSHLLAALLRCKGIPTGFCYQKLILDDDNAPYLILHGLAGVYIKEIDKWIRLDARGNKEGVNAQFSLNEEKLAFPIRPEKGEADIPIVFAAPDKNVITSLTTNSSVKELWADLPRALSSK